MTGKPNRHDQLAGGATPLRPEPGAPCPVCTTPLVQNGDRVACDRCGYPENSAAWVDYDGCC